MASNFNARLQLKKDSHSNWLLNNPVLLDGEVAYAVMENGEIQFKVGDGASKYSALPFIESLIAWDKF